MKKILFAITFLAMSAVAMADEVSFTASAPSSVANGSSFQLVYTVNAKGKDLRVPDFAGFDVLMGPSTSTSSSVQIINGKMSSETIVRYTYVLSPTKEGTFNIPSATITVDKQRYQSNALTIKVLPADQAQQNAQPQGGNRGNQQQAVAPQQAITSDNLFMRTIVSKTRVHEQEAILLSYKIYSKVDVVNLGDVKLPDLQGFLVQEIEQPRDLQFVLENYNGSNYNTLTLKQYLIFPQRTGTIEIEKANCTAVVRVRSQRQVRSYFDDFFDTYQEVNKPLATAPIKITVDALPTPKPADFCGGVGNFSVKSSINANEINANDAITITVKISGSGNIKLLKTPEVKFPADFETYEPKVTNDFKNTTSGATGTKTIEYLAIPRHSGDYEIPETTFSYYDLSSKTYKSLSIPAYTLKVNKGAAQDNAGAVSNFTNQEQVRMLANDIRYIDTNDFALAPKATLFAGTADFWLCYLVPLLLSGLALWFFRKQAKQNADLAMVRNKKANKVARRRLKIAAKYLKDNDKAAFYDEVLRSLWGYVGDKLALPLSELNKENIASKLADRHVPQSDADAFLQLLNDCEFARYAPAADQHAEMDHIFSQTLNLIERLEETI